MSDARWERLQVLFEGLLERPPASREAWLAEVEPDPDLRAEALALVAAEDGGEDGITRQLREAAARVGTTTPTSGRQLGPYRLIGEIGSGGMGTVFLAERVDQHFDQRVAIKLLRGLPTRESTERMRRERQILADLSHPHIARLLDGGTTADGQPYLVMEYVDGVPLHEFCRSRDLPLRDRLQLLLKICSAVQYAHQRLVIHRDLKPANVLVRGDGEPVLLDFGIAKLLGETGGTAQQTGLPWFTPAYASPEQRKGQPVSTATDVHGLGLLLYETISDSVPTRDDGGRLPPPSRIARRRLPPELDLIVAKATHVEPERRYVSASALADDITRFLRGRPVHAAPDRLHYRLAKFVGRHRFASAACVVAIALAGWFTWRLANERDRALRAEALAQQQSATANSVVDYLVALFRSASPEEAGTRPIAPRDLVDRGRREIDTRLADAPQQRARLLGALGKIYLELGLPDDAADSLGRAAELERTHGTPRQRATYLSEQGFAMNLAERPAAAGPVLREALAALGTVAPEDRKLAADILSTLGLSQARNGDATAGIASAQRALDYAAAAEGADSVRYAQCLYALAEAEMRNGRLDDAERDARRSIETMRKRLPDDADEVIQAKGFLTEVYEQQGRYADGERLLREMLETRLRTLDPGSAWAVTARNNLAQAIQLQGRIVEATALLQQNVDLMRANHHERTPSYTIGLNNLASLLEQAGDYPTSLAMFREVLDNALKQSVDAEDPRLPIYRQNLGRSLMLNGKLDAARVMLDMPVEGNADSLDLRVERARRLAHLGDWMRRSHRYDEAMAYLDQSSAAFAELYPPTHARQGAIARLRGLVLRDRGRLGEAESQLRRAVEILSASAGAHANSTIDAQLQLADVLVARGNREEARALYDAVGPLLPTRFVEGSPTRRLQAELGRKLGTTLATSG
ncbi:serine/threonine-protein kinase [Dokdonella fugitiva]|jgi:serine/threonine-protein kinase|uniref:Serine/threonine-protein kinase n=1 Tax=Dokdonella fugitiva TaxID=328517 RepID=A0A4R2I8M9_9GAMM|nr:serine/threonine-protein kinase [Dokdonella fugitiva]MBA8883406.1 serine/threonine-protein kinase [Dokdonella fugitiva]TCO40723.1 serine/threonine-protein kinase [Dokdonella fugitiva]